MNDIENITYNNERRSSKGKNNQTELLDNFRRFSKPNTDINSASTSSVAATVEFGLSLAEQLKLANYQTVILQQTWPKIRLTVFNNVIKQLMLRNAIAKELFQKMNIVGKFCDQKRYDQKEHVKLLVELFDFAIQSLNNPFKITQKKCREYGEIHFSIYKQDASKMWDDLGDCLSESLAKMDGIRGKREVFRSWILLLSFLIDSMKAGYLAQCKRKSVSKNLPQQINLAMSSSTTPINYSNITSTDQSNYANSYITTNRRKS